MYVYTKFVASTKYRTMASFERWYMDEETTTDQRLPHKAPGAPEVTTEALTELGITYFKLDPQNYEEQLGQIREQLKFSFADEVRCAPDSLANYEQTLKSFFTEHLHADDEVRFFLEGSGYFDVRDKQDRWIRMALSAGDLVILPAGIYHRFTLDTNDYARVMRLFCGEPVWTAINRPADTHDARTRYINSLA